LGQDFVVHDPREAVLNRALREHLLSTMREQRPGFVFSIDVPVERGAPGVQLVSLKDLISCPAVRQPMLLPLQPSFYGAEPLSIMDRESDGLSGVMDVRRRVVAPIVDQGVKLQPQSFYFNPCQVLPMGCSEQLHMHI
jgi:hypothetical protein